MGAVDPPEIRCPISLIAEKQSVLHCIYKTKPNSPVGFD